jgi:hypothetical protein
MAATTIQIFNAIQHSLFSAAAELAPLRHTRRPTSSGSLEERMSKAKSSMVVAVICPKILNGGFLIIEKSCRTGL